MMKAKFLAVYFSAVLALLFIFPGSVNAVTCSYWYKTFEAGGECGLCVYNFETCWDGDCYFVHDQTGCAECSGANCITYGSCSYAATCSQTGDRVKTTCVPSCSDHDDDSSTKPKCDDTCSDQTITSATACNRDTSTTACGTQDCDTLDTTCRDYHDVNKICSSGSCPASVTCNSYTNAADGTSCNSGNGKCYSGSCDSTAPSVDSVSINSGAAYTTSTSVTVDATCSDGGSGMKEIRIKCDENSFSEWGKCIGCTIQPYSCTLKSTQGTRTVNVECKDNAGKVGSGTDTIVYDSTAPTSAFKPNNPTWLTGGITLTEITDSDTGGSGLATCKYHIYDSGITNDPNTERDERFTVDRGTRTCDQVPVTVSASGNCRTQGTGKCTVYIYSTDNAGNLMDPPATKAFSIDYTAPTANIDTAAGWKRTLFPLQYDCTDAIGISECRLFINIIDRANNRETGWEDTGTVTAGTDQTVNIDLNAARFSGDRVCSIQGSETCKLKLVAKDTAGNTAESIRTFSIDWTRPTVKFPNPGYARPSSTPTNEVSVPYNREFTYYSHASDGESQVSSCDFYIDTNNIGAMTKSCDDNNQNCDTTYARTFSIPQGETDFKVKRSNKVSARCTDLAGNVGNSGDATVTICGQDLPTHLSRTTLFNGCDVSLSVYSRDNDEPDRPVKASWSVSNSDKSITVKIDDVGNDCDFDDIQFINYYKFPNPLENIPYYASTLSVGSFFMKDGSDHALRYGYNAQTYGTCKILGTTADSTTSWNSFTTRAIENGVCKSPADYLPSSGTQTTTVSIPDSDAGCESHKLTIGECLGNSDCNFDAARTVCITNPYAQYVNKCRSCRNTVDDADYMGSFMFYADATYHNEAGGRFIMTIPCDVRVLSEYWYVFDMIHIDPDPNVEYIFDRYGGQIGGRVAFVVDAKFTSGSGTLDIDLYQDGSYDSVLDTNPGTLLTKSCASITGGKRCTFTGIDVIDDRIFYNLKITKSSGSGNVEVNTRIVECLVSDDRDGGSYNNACYQKYGGDPTAVCDPLFAGIGGKCVQCNSNLNLNPAVDSIDNDQCRRVGTTCASFPNRYARCNLDSSSADYKTCKQCASCLVRTDCVSGYCCTKESSPGPGEGTGRCVSLTTVINPYLCEP